MAAAVLDAQRIYGPHDRALAEVGTAALGRRLYCVLPEDAHDRQPCFAPPVALVADARVDNREELGTTLRVAPLSRLSDSRLIWEAYKAWGEEWVRRVVGEYAVAVWDGATRALTLFRDPSGEKPLHYHRGEGWVAFASTPAGLRVLPGVGTLPDRALLAKFVADVPRSGPASYFEGILRVEPGQAVTLTASGCQSREAWRMPTTELRLPHAEQYVEAYREHLDRAVAVRLRGAGPAVGAHLSGGLDSSGVAATAARLLRPGGGRVVAFTSAPRSGFAGPAYGGRVADETLLAGAVAALHPNIEHEIVRGALSPVQIAARDAALFGEPLGLPCNQVWWSAIHDAARARGLSVLLTGERGNGAFSAGGVETLSELIRRRRLAAWTRAAASLLGTGPRLRGILFGSFAPWLPRPVWAWLNQRAYGRSAGQAGLDLVSARYRPALANAPARRACPPRGDYLERWDMVTTGDPGLFRKGVLAHWGVEERDPTTDRLLVEFCFSVPPEVLVGEGVTRRLARLGLADRVHADVLHGPRGYQGADWYEGITPATLKEAIDGAPPSGVVDRDALSRLAATWPTGGWEHGDVIGPYRLGLLRALAAARFEAAVSAPLAHSAHDSYRSVS